MMSEQITIALAGNPNVGKSTIFNKLTGMKQHTGNWPGKTVEIAEGFFSLGSKRCRIVDLPGTYSISANSEDEEVARDFICFSDSEVVLVVADATALERNLSLLLQILEIKGKGVLCVNLMDEAEKQHITPDLNKLEKMLNIPVVGTKARNGKGIEYLLCCIQESVFSSPKTQKWVIYPEGIEQAVEEIEKLLPEFGGISSRWVALKLLEDDISVIKAIEKNYEINLKETEFYSRVYEKRESLKQEGLTNIADICTAQRIQCAEKIAKGVVETKEEFRRNKLDRILTSKTLGIPIMMLMLCAVFCITIEGANYPSQWLGNLLFGFENILQKWFIFLPETLQRILVDGMYHTLAWVVSVMLPPMAIFFPLFALLEDSGFLPRIAFNMDRCLRIAKAHGRQALTMCQGFGCNACGVMGCRIINSPRERLIAIITNNFVPCNGRFPTIIVLITLFFSAGNTAISSLALLGVIALSVGVTLIISRLLSETLLKGQPSSFVMELPPYRKPQFFKVLVRSFADRTLFVLGRAVIAAVPAGAIIWLLANIKSGDNSILYILGSYLKPLGNLMGLDGYILLAFILGFPANEIVIPILIMCYTASGKMTDISQAAELGTLLKMNGWNTVTALCVIVFSVMHFPCATTCQTIYKETKSIKWTMVSILIPTLTGICMCILINFVSGFFV